MSLSSVSFNGVQSTTKAGNPYNKTKTGKVVGTTIGGAYVAYSALKMSKNLKSHSVLKNLVSNFGKDGAREAIKLSKRAAGVISGIVIAAGLGIGAIVDGCINKSRQKKADSAAQV